METLNKAQPPDLISNIEVMRLLDERVSVRKKELQEQIEEQEKKEAEEAATEEEEGEDGVKKRKKKKKIIRTHPKLQQRDWIEEQVLEYLKATPCSRADFEKLPTLVTKLRGKGIKGFGLTKAESLQLLNFMPTESVDIHLMIEDLQSRITPEERQEELLNTVRECLLEEENTDAAAAGEENDDDDNNANDPSSTVAEDEDEKMEDAKKDSETSKDDKMDVDEEIISEVLLGLGRDIGKEKTSSEVGKEGGNEEIIGAI